MDKARVVDIRFLGSYGSGYLITNRLILTAKHVARSSKLGAVCKVTPLIDADDQSRGLAQASSNTFPAELIWRSPKKDVALLSITSTKGVPGLSSKPVATGRVSSEHGRLRCEGIGFPEAKNAGSQNEEHHLHGYVSWAVRGRNLEIDVINATPRNPNHWRGYSGAAIFSRGLLIGVVCSYDKPYAGKLLHAVPVEEFYRESGFLEYVGNIRLDDTSVVSPELGHQVLRHICFIDRDPQVDEVLSRLNYQRESASSQPLIFMVTGRDDDDHRRLIERLGRENVVQQYLGMYGEPRDVIKEIRWPAEAKIDPESKFEHYLCGELYNVLGSWLSSEDRHNTTTLRRLINDRRTKIGIWHRISLDRARDGHGELLRRWLNFWHDLDVRPSGTNTLVFLCMVKDEGPLQPSSISRLTRTHFSRPDKEVRLTLKEAQNAGRLIPLYDLGQIEPDHVASWVENIRDRYGLAHSDELQFLRMRIESEIASGLPMRTFNRYVTQMLGFSERLL